MTLDQQRARFAWGKAKERMEHQKAYATVAKSAPAFIMANGLMQALAFYQSRKNDEAKQLTADIAEWLQRRMLPTTTGEFESVMNGLYRMPSTQYMTATREALAMLRWLRLFTDALKAGSPEVDNASREGVARA